MNLVGVVIPGEREAAIPGRCVTYPVTNAEPERVVVNVGPVAATGLFAVAEGGAIG